MTRKASSWYGRPAQEAISSWVKRGRFSDVQTAVSGQTGQQDVFEIQGRCLAAGTDVTHD